MKFLQLIIVIFVTFSIIGCGKDKAGIDSSMGEAVLGQEVLLPIAATAPVRVCTIENKEDGAYLVCDDNSNEKLSNDLSLPDGTTCMVEAMPEGTKITCQDGTSAMIQDDQTIIIEEQASPEESEENIVDEVPATCPHKTKRECKKEHKSKCKKKHAKHFAKKIKF